MIVSGWGEMVSLPNISARAASLWSNSSVEVSREYVGAMI